MLKLRPDALRELIKMLPVRAMSASQVVMPTSARSSCLPIRRSRMSLRSKNSCMSLSQTYRCRHCCVCINSFIDAAASFALSQYTNLPFASIKFCAKLNAKSSSGATSTSLICPRSSGKGKGVVVRKPWRTACSISSLFLVELYTLKKIVSLHQIVLY